MVGASCTADADCDAHEYCNTIVCITAPCPSIGTCQDQTRFLRQRGRRDPGQRPNGVTREIVVDRPASNVAAAHVSVNIDHTWRGDLRVVLTSPSGTERVLPRPHREQRGRPVPQRRRHRGLRRRDRGRHLVAPRERSRAPRRRTAAHLAHSARLREPAPEPEPGTAVWAQVMDLDRERARLRERHRPDVGPAPLLRRRDPRAHSASRASTSSAATTRSP